MIILLTGSDTWKVEQDIERLRRHFIDKFDATGLNVAEHSFEDEYNQVMGAITTAPFLSEKRLVVVRDLPLEASESFQKLVQKVSGTSILLLIAKHESGSSEKLHIYLSSITHVPYHYHAYDTSNAGNEANITEIATHYGIHLSQGQKTELTIYGWNIVKLHTLFAALASATQGPVEESLWRICVPKQEEQKAFELFDAIITKNPVAAHALITATVASGSELAPLWSMIYTQLRKYYALALSQEHFASVAADMGISFFEQNKVKKALMLDNGSYVKRVFGRFEDIEKQGKKSKEHIVRGLWDLVSLTLDA